MKTHKAKPRKRLFNKLNKNVDSTTKHDNLEGVKYESENDRLEILKRNYEQEIKGKKHEIMLLEAKLRNVIELAKESEKLRSPATPENKYASHGLTAAVLDAVGSLWRANKGTVHGVSAAQIRDFIILHGFMPKAEPHNFNIAFHVTLKRLCENQRIECDATLGKNFYKPVKDHES